MSVSFDAEVKIGEIRVFADAKEPLVAAVVEARGLAGWRIVPVSNHRVPVAENELQLGERVFQLWNVCTASKGFISRSWVVDTLAGEDLDRLRSAASSVKPLSGRLGDYERRALAVGGDFAGWQAKFPAKRKWVWPTASWAAAAMVLISVGVFYLLPESDQEQAVRKCTVERALSVQMVREERVPDLEPPEPEVADAAAAPEAADIDLQVVKEEIRSAEPAPRVSKLVELAKKAPAFDGRMERMRRGAAVAKGAVPAACEAPVVAAERKLAANKAKSSFNERVARSLAELKAMQKPDGSWGKKPVKDTALAVLAMMAHGETAGSKEYGKALTAGVKYLTEANLKGQSRQDIQSAACALCCATATMRNPNIRTAAEKALASIDDRRSVEAGRDWIGLLVDLTRPAIKTSASRVATKAPEKDEVAETSILVLQLLSAAENY